MDKNNILAKMKEMNQNKSGSKVETPKVEVETPKKIVIEPTKVEEVKVEETPKQEVTPIKEEVEIISKEEVEITSKEEVIAITEDKVASKKKILNMPIYLPKGMYDDFLELVKELNTTNPKLALLLEKEYYRDFGKDEMVEEEETLDSLIQKKKLSKVMDLRGKDMRKNVIQVYVPNELEKERIIANRNSLGIKITSDYFRLVFDRMIPIAKEKLNKID